MQAQFKGDVAKLDEAIAALDPVVALLSLIQITGDRTLLHTLKDEFDPYPYSYEGLSSVGVTEAATRAFVDEMDTNLAHTAWVQCGEAHGYYRDKGKKVVLAVPRHNSHIWHVTRSPRTEDFVITRAPGAEPVQVREMDLLTI
ncbi:hypothetical protein [Novosphingobium sp. Fuku2-ISO-50]|uniref:hypothetical protein n=1 Tax=Novosphingobium sp. Fuku2-ISO-50 TaxID=1739114 RepID=UPI00076BDAF2|nr:hypothetical protein [Novosphingobium sp. Fuku2-ISO-50]KUR81107.1 hypothetical protein AQZ50_00555 [Novosphingobium sp. Fuku2-ISO-50]